MIQVVVVDDEEQITDILKEYLLFAIKEIEIHAFNDSLAAKAFIEQNPVDVLITDFKMPRFDGVQLMESVSPNLRKIMISGYLSEIGEERLKDLNATFFSKPVPLRTIAKLVSEYQEELS